MYNHVNFSTHEFRMHEASRLQAGSKCPRQSDLNQDSARVVRVLGKLKRESLDDLPTMGDVVPSALS
jgi:hypothetical protein